ncbi:Fanconi anemia group G protein-like [Acropora muricata]|uniref:Fanconi anemia group G protein-like n=1 Tax=Acropora muricata TaxID=159855 RepID=UPI0034E40683
MSLTSQLERSRDLVNLTSSGSGDVPEILKPSKHLKKYADLLKKATFSSFDVKEWIIENNLLVHQLIENKHDIDITVEKFESLLERVQGVPPELSNICYELAVAYNVSYLKLRGQSNYLSVGGHHKSASILHKTLFRAFEALKIDGCLQEASTADTTLFSASNIDQTQKQQVSSLLQAFCNNGISIAPLVLNCSLMVYLWLLDEFVNKDKSVELLTLIQNHLKHVVEKLLKYIPTEEVSPGRCPLFMFNLKDIPSLTSCIAASPITNLADGQSLLSLVTTLLAFSHFANKNYSLVLTTLQERNEEEDVCFSDLYLKGFIFYVRNEAKNALPLFQQCVHISKQAQQKVASFVMLGCCYATQGKHQTAVAKFKQALQHDFKQMEALFNICIQYRKLGNLEAEIQGLKLLKQAISIRVESGQCYNVTGVASDASMVFIKQGLEMTIPPQFCFNEGTLRTGMKQEFATCILAQRSAELGRFEEASNCYLELLSNALDTSSSFTSTSANLMSPTELYHQCVRTLLKAARYQDALTVCEKLLTTVHCRLNTDQQGDSGHDGSSKAPRKRLHSKEADTLTLATDKEIAVDCEMRLLKATALIQLQQPLEALQVLNRVLTALGGVKSFIFYSSHQADQEAPEEPQPKQQRKRRKLDAGGTSAFLEREENETTAIELVKLKVLAYKQKASILESLGQTQDALYQLHLSLECLPDDPGAVFKHTQLLFKLGSEVDAINNWLEFRGIKFHHKEELSSIKKILSSSVVKFVDEEDVNLEQVKVLDQLVVNQCSRMRAGVL